MAQLQVGEVLDGRYRIDTPIARGGMSTVYRSVDLRLGRAVAAKVMDDRYESDPIFRTRFKREARSMAQLNHPNLVNVYDFSSEGSYVFLIMELITGGTLRELLAERGPMPPHAATAVMRSVLTGLAVAHRTGLIHRDIKPDNVLINGDHRVKLADFGLVRAASQPQAATSQIIGTVAYLSPEQVEGKDIGPESDVYSAGILLFELLTGTTPFSGETQLAHAYKRLTEPVPPPSSRIDGVPELFDNLVAEATHMEPEHRFANAQEFLDALNDVASELELPAFTVPIPQNAAAHRATEIVQLPTDLITTETPKIEQSSSENLKEGAAETSVLPPVAETRQFEPITPTIQPPMDPRPDTAPVPAIAVPAHPLPANAVPANDPATRYDAQQVEVTDDAVGTELSGAGGMSISSNDDHGKPVSNRSRIKLIAWLIIVALIVAAVAVGGWWFGSGRYGEIPQVLGMDKTAATSSVTEAGFKTGYHEVYSDDVPVGQIAGTDPPFGNRVPRGQQVAILVSLGRPTIPAIPTDYSVERFRSQLEERTLTMNMGADEYSDTVPAGGIVKTSPASGQEVKTKSQVTVSLSKGPAPVSVPDVAGMDADRATETLKQAGLKVVGYDEVFSSNIGPDKVVTSSPAPNTMLTRGSEIRLQVSNAMEIPKVEGKSLEDVQKILNEAGFAVTVNTDPSKSADAPNTVMSISPKEGTLVNPATPSVTVTVNGLVDVPSVVGKKYSEAAKILEKAGFTVSNGSSGNSTDDKKKDSRVISQTPKGGSEAKLGTEIILRTLS